MSDAIIFLPMLILFILIQIGITIRCTRNNIAFDSLDFNICTFQNILVCLIWPVSLIIAIVVFIPIGVVKLLKIKESKQ